MPTIMLIRHGSTDMNNASSDKDCIRGWKDVPLSKEGIQEAKDLASEIDDPPDVLVSSDLSRASDTADIVSKEIDVPVSVVSKSFRPWDVGKYQGKLSKDVVPIIADYAANRPDEKLPEGESFNEFKGRFFQGIESLIDLYPGKSIAIASHHRNERLLAAWEAKGFPPDGDIDQKVFASKGAPPGSICEFAVPERKLEEVIDEVA
jgi:2,3-bisphosphoglycerate-dependent phosphoglycerate mutase